MLTVQRWHCTDGSFVMNVDPKLFSFVGCTCVDGVSEAYSKVDEHGDNLWPQDLSLACKVTGCLTDAGLWCCNDRNSSIAYHFKPPSKVIIARKLL